MRSFLAVATLLSFLVTYVSATALTYRMVPNEKSCFYAWVEEKGVKMAFYFAVRTLTNALTFAFPQPLFPLPFAPNERG